MLTLLVVGVLSLGAGAVGGFKYGKKAAAAVASAASTLAK